jgi:hypothetical protein
MLNLKSGIQAYIVHVSSLSCTSVEIPPFHLPVGRDQLISPIRLNPGGRCSCAHESPDSRQAAVRGIRVHEFHVES